MYRQSESKYIYMWLFFTCSECGKRFPELAHMEKYGRNGEFVIELDDSFLQEAYPPADPIQQLPDIIYV
jgi:hypothetical protein